MEPCPPSFSPLRLKKKILLKKTKKISHQPPRNFLLPGREGGGREREAEVY
jgi:hypothetical protein